MARCRSRRAAPSLPTDRCASDRSSRARASRGFTCTTSLGELGVMGCGGVGWGRRLRKCTAHVTVLSTRQVTHCPPHQAVDQCRICRYLYRSKSMYLPFWRSIQAPQRLHLQVSQMYADADCKSLGRAAPSHPSYYLKESTAACWSPTYASSMTPMVLHTRVSRVLTPPDRPPPWAPLITCRVMQCVGGAGRGDDYFCAGSFLGSSNAPHEFTGS